MHSDPNHYVILGQVVGVFGIKGWVKVRSDTDPPSNILSYNPWYLAKNTEYHPLELVAGQRHNKGLIAQLTGCEDRDAAAALVGSNIAVLRSQLPATAEGEYYWSDLIGLEVYTRQLKHLGRVTNLMQTGANDVLVVQGDEEILIPYVWNHYIYKVDLEAGRIEVDWEIDAEAGAQDEREEQ